MENNKKVLVLLDAHAILHRAFHALPPSFKSPTGEPTNALYGFSSFLLKVIRELKPDYITACYDLPEPTFRHAAYDKYKSQRPKMDDNLAPQINRSREILEAFNIPIYDKAGFEADDILGSIVEQLNQLSAISYQLAPIGASGPPELQIVIASGDLDTLQLVRGDEVIVFTPSRGIQEAVTYNEEKVKERYGFGPGFVTDYKALKGDPSDNIIGVKGIGDKTATELIQKFGGIEKIYEILKSGGGKEKLQQAGIKERTIKLLEENEEEALFSKTLAEIRKDAPIKFSLETAEWGKNFNSQKAEKLFTSLGFRSLIDRLPGSDII